MRSLHDVGEVEALEDLDDLVDRRRDWRADDAATNRAPWPRRSDTASPMVSSGVRSANS